MNMDFTFEESPWERTLDTLHPGDSFSAARFLTLMEGEDEAAVEDAFADLEMSRVTLDITDLPKASGTGEAAVRLRREEQLAGRADFVRTLDENDPLRLYLEELAGIPAFGDPALLALELAEGNTSVQERLVNLSLSRVVELAKAHTGQGVLLMDLIQEGSLGLWEGILAYEGGEFEPHIQWWIRQGMAKAVVLQARAGGVLEHMRKNMEAFREADRRLLTELGRNATLEEIAAELHISPEEADVLQELIRSAQALEKATRAPAESEEGETEAVEDTAQFKARQRVLDMLSGLTEQEAQVVTLRFGLEGGAPMTAQETGRKLGLTADQVVALETAALAKMRKEEENS